MIIKGNIVELNEDARCFRLDDDNNSIIHITIKELKNYKVYLEMEPYVEVLVEDEARSVKISDKKTISAFDMVDFCLIKKIEGEKETTYYDICEIRGQVKTFLNSLGYKMFLDLEFSWPVPYTHMPTEIVQYGYIITDKDDKIVEKDSALVKPSRKSALNKKTLKFLGREEADFDKAISYISFYQMMQRLIKKYDMKIIAWGRNDMLEIEQSYKINHLTPLDTKKRFINIMQVIKNYYQLKKEIGLFNTYKQLTNQEFHEQTHDALEDAALAKEIFEIFKKQINKK